MKEREILQKIKNFVQDFDQRAGRAVKKVVLPATLGLGLVLAPGCGQDEDPDNGRARPTQARGKADGPDGGMVALYAAPFPGTFDAGVPLPQPEYAAPFPDAGGPVALYAAPFPGAASCENHCGDQAVSGCYCDDACSLPENNDCCDDKAAKCDTVPEPDPGPVALYAAPFPGAASCEDNCGGKAESGCYCDDLCSTFTPPDCCTDKVEKCDADPGPVALYAAPFPDDTD